MSRALAATVCALVFAGPALGSPQKTRSTTRATKTAVKPAGAATTSKAATRPRHDGAHARVAFGQAGVLRPTAEAVGRRAEPLTIEEETAKQIEKLLRGPLRSGVTGLYVADAHTGEALFAVNADDPLNPASNVKMISTATALELLGPTFRYTTRLLGPMPDAAGAITGNVYLLGTWDPTLEAADLDEIATQLAARGVHKFDGDVIVGSDPTRDGIYRAVVPIEIHAGEPGDAPTATLPAGFDLVTVKVTAKTEKKPSRRPHLTYQVASAQDAAGHARIALTIGGTIGKGGSTTYGLATKERTAFASHVLRAALRAHQIAVTGDIHVGELGPFIDAAAAAGSLPIELGHHDSPTLGDIVTRVNKWSINWLADRVIMTAAALSRSTTPSMDVALDAMYAWLARHPHLSKDDVIVDTGSGLSYRTRITPRELVSIVRTAGGFEAGLDPKVAETWLGSLSVSGTDGTLRRRFKTPDTLGMIHGKTGTLSTVIALSGVLELDPTRPLVFSIVTNGDRPLSKGYVRKAHEQVVAVLCKYLARTAKPTTQLPPGADAPHDDTPAVTPADHPQLPDDIEETDPDPQLDAETAGQPAPPAVTPAP